MTREELASKVGISTRYLAALENTNKKPSYKILNHLFTELEIPPDLVFDRKGAIKNSSKEKLQGLINICTDHELQQIMEFVYILLFEEGEYDG